MSLKSDGFVRGASKSVVIQWLSAYIACHSVCQGIEKLCNISFSNSHQHKGSTITRINTDNLHAQKFHEWFKVHSPFPKTTDLLSISTGVIGNELI